MEIKETSAGHFEATMRDGRVAQLHMGWDDAIHATMLYHDGGAPLSFDETSAIWCQIGRGDYEAHKEDGE